MGRFNNIEYDHTGREIQEKRACTLPNKDGLYPVISFSPNNQHQFPCEIELKKPGAAPTSLMPRIPTSGCLNQRREGYCPREISLTAQELKP